MSDTDSGRGGRPREFSDQALLKVFDYADEPVITASDIVDGLHEHFDVDVTTEAVRQRLNNLEADGVVGRKEFGANAVGWWAKVAPELSPEAARRVEESKERGEFIALEDG